MPKPLTSILKHTCIQNLWSQALNFITGKLLICACFHLFPSKDLVLQTQLHPVPLDL